MGDDARYFHSSLYSFEDERARTGVLNKFHTTINNAAARCWYDSKRHEFQLVCPSYLGNVADEALWKAISEYVEEELSAAEQQEREPAIQRFPESQFDSLDAFGDEGEEVEPVSRYGSVGRPRVTHIIAATEAEGRLLQPFRLFELPGDWLERAIGPRTEDAAKLFSVGITCRAVRKQDAQGYVFNGRTGVRHGLADMDEENLGLAPFGVVHDERSLPTNVDEKPKKWKHVGRPPTIQQWVLGVGDVTDVQDEAEIAGAVESKPEMSQDTRKFLAESRTNAFGRARMPKGASLLPEDDEDFEPETAAPTQTKQAFTSLLASNDSDHESANTSPKSSSSVGSSNGGPGAFANVLGSTGSRPAHRASSDLSTIKSQTRAVAHSLSIATNSSATRGTPPIRSPDTIIATPAVSQLETDDAFPTYGAAYAKVDRIGLTASAANTAEWQDKYSSREVKRKTLPITARAQTQRSRQVSEASASVSNSGSPGSSRSRSRVFSPGSSAASKQAFSASQVARAIPAEQAPNGDWVNKVVSANVSHSGLVDTAARQSSHAVPLPPGLSTGQPRTRPRSQLAVSTATHELAVSIIDYSESLLDAPNSELNNIEPQLDYNAVLTPTVVSSQGTARGLDTHDERDDDNIVEKVHVFPPGFATKRQTMRQKAAKKNKHKSLSKASSKSAPARPVLELPDPVPPPKKKKEEPPPRLTGLQRERRGNRSQAASETPQPQSARPHSIQDPALPFGQQLLESLAALNATSNDDTDEDDDDEEYREAHEGDLRALVSPQPRLKLVAQIGLLLTRSKVLGDNVYSPEAMQTKLNDTVAPSETIFIPRLTTSTGDVKHLVDLGGKSDQQFMDAFYQVHLRDTSGNQWKLTVPMSAGAQYSLTALGLFISRAFLHYPMHVWDAQIGLVQPGEDCTTPVTQAVAELVASMQTDGAPPSLRLKVSSASITLESVSAKQTITQDHDGLIYRLTKVQDLFLEPLEEVRHNFKATATPRDDMIATQRLWWEAGFETCELARAEEIQARLNELVPNIDGVGLNNQGPFRMTEPEDEGFAATHPDEGQKGTGADWWFW